MDSSTVKDSGGRDAKSDAGHDSGSPADTGAPKDTGHPEDTGIDTGIDTGVDATPTVASNVLYLENNEIVSGMNGVVAYARAADGSLTALAGSPFSTGGTGAANAMQALGPDDNDQQVAVTPDHTHLYAVNGGSNTIAAFDIKADGSLTPVAGSPFPSGGDDPGSIGIAGSFLYVVNQADVGDAGAGPNYTAFTIAADGSLLPIANSTVAAGKSPSVALVSHDDKHLFGADFLSFTETPAANPLRSFTIGSGGLLTAAPGTPMALPVVDGGTPPGTPPALGLGLHPTLPILYVGFVLRKQIGVYTYDATTGALMYVTAASVSGPAPCWVRVSADGKYLYVTDTADDSVSVLDATNAMAPTEIQHLQLKNLGPTYDSGMGGAPTSQSYDESLSPDGKYLYVVSENTNPDLTRTEGNVLHILDVAAATGMVTETATPITLGGSPGTRAQGLVVF